MNPPLLRRCDGFSRREILRFTGVGALGLSLPRLLQARQRENAAVAKAKSCILIWLDGGPSHLETFDPKPEAPVEVRGPFGTISSSVPGVALSEHLPRTAARMKQLAIIRSMTSPLGEHGLANEYLLTGYRPSPVLAYPSYGSVLAYMRKRIAALPPYIVVPEPNSAHGAGFLGAAYEPFKIAGGQRGALQVNDLQAFPGVTEDRLGRRRAFLAEFDAAQRTIEECETPSEGSFEQAFRLVTSPEAKAAFNIDAEPDAVRKKYGDRSIGKACLLARRLIEADVPFVTVFDKGWDTHENIDLTLRAGYAGAQVGVGLIPSLDVAFSALLDDLESRGRLDETLVIVMGEFGRTPKLNPRGGRDHWPRVFSVVMAGGGVRGGQVIGASDRVGESPLEEPVTPVDLAYTIYTLLGVDPNYELHTADGRPVPVNQGGRMIPHLIA